MGTLYVSSKRTVSKPDAPMFTISVCFDDSGDL